MTIAECIKEDICSFLSDKVISDEKLSQTAEGKLATLGTSLLSIVVFEECHFFLKPFIFSCLFSFHIFRVELFMQS